MRTACLLVKEQALAALVMVLKQAIERLAKIKFGRRFRSR